MAASSGSGARGRPRDPDVEDRIVRAAVDELAEVGVAAFSLNSVAARARVAKRSIYSRWPDREGLVAAGLASLSVGLEPPRTGTLSGDLEMLFDQIADMLAEPRRSVLARCAAELASYPVLYAAFKRDVIDQSMAVIEGALVDARARGEVRSGDSPALVAEVFVSAIFGRSTYAPHTQPGGVPEMKSGLIAVTLHALAWRPTTPG
ncbi:TetR/AcrR family transcriptional regulator [Cryptosporangium aurantiacum]|uniref:Transcriptional regulator, TetR family n=1 Tax=Cryptosporangium aurantiacum TaxID=134849 RepID=A0A1M7PI41_9ACTN|nr:TetR/AcrR family transcriptional regulator [Cryptosporangium aurantiacum]SHN16397.1 transcriptional regulator, TetR family [Cryptosporangium aurantiacum]